ncbi:unnamed protein product, partial [Prorocentrum cordatum]
MVPALPETPRPLAALLTREIRSGAVAVAKVVRNRESDVHVRMKPFVAQPQKKKIGVLKLLVLAALLVVNALLTRSRQSSLDDLFRAFKDEIAASVEAKLGSLRTTTISEISNHSTGLIRAVAARQDAVNQQFQTQATDIQARSDVLEQSQFEMRRQLDEMRKELYCQERAIPVKDYEDVQVRGRQPGPTVRIANLSEMASKESVNAELTEWLTQAGVAENQYKLIGDSHSKRYVIQMLGNGDAAQRKLRAARRALQRDGQTWRQFGVAAVPGGRAQIFVRLDKSARQIRGVVFIDSIPTITVQTGDAFGSKSRLLWNCSAVTSHGVGQKALPDTFNATFHGVE